MEKVVPHAGTWIEIVILSAECKCSTVVPHAGTWIEMPWIYSRSSAQRSFPTRERGLKC